MIDCTLNSSATARSRNIALPYPENNAAGTRGIGLEAGGQSVAPKLTVRKRRAGSIPNDLVAFYTQ